MYVRDGRILIYDGIDSGNVRRRQAHFPTRRFIDFYNTGLDSMTSDYMISGADATCLSLDVIDGLPKCKHPVALEAEERVSP